MKYMPKKFINYTSNPKYTLMRGFARFEIFRNLVLRISGLLNKSQEKKILLECEALMSQSIFKGTNPRDFIDTLEKDGAAFGIEVPAEDVLEILRYADNNPCFADREVDKGFFKRDLGLASRSLKKSVLVAQYFNVLKECDAVKKIAADPFILWISTKFLRGAPKLVGVNLWWTFPGSHTLEDRSRHAHLFHRDIDCFRFFKFFFYLTDVEEGDGGHVLVVGSHNSPPSTGGRNKTGRYADEEIKESYAVENILEIVGTSGIGFAENTLCIHKGLTPKKNPRLLLQFEYALFDYGVTDDARDPNCLKMINYKTD